MPSSARTAATPHTIRYGVSASQLGDLHLPGVELAPVVCLLHGGFWRMPYGREELDPVARDLVARGFAVWNLEYSRVGAREGGWPGTFIDVAAGIDHLAALVEEGFALDLDRVVVAGHSAGGHLALWSAARHRKALAIAGPSRVRPIAAAGLAAVADLARTYALGAGNSAVGELLQGSPAEQPERYAAASPRELLPLGVAQLIVHGARDEALPVELARGYVSAAKAAGDDVRYCELPLAGHMDYLDPASEAHETLCRWLAQATL